MVPEGTRKLLCDRREAFQVVGVGSGSKHRKLQCAADSGLLAEHRRRYCFVLSFVQHSLICDTLRRQLPCRCVACWCCRSGGVYRGAVHHAARVGGAARGVRPLLPGEPRRPRRTRRLLRLRVARVCSRVQRFVSHS